MDKLDLRQRLLLQRESKRQEEVLNKQNAIKAAQDLAFLGVPFKEICKGANVDSTQLKAFYYDCGLPTSYSKKRRGEFMVADDDSRDVRTLAAIVSTNDLVHRLPQYNGTQFGRNRWSRLVEIENEDYERNQCEKKERSGATSAKSSTPMSLSRPDLLKAIQDQIEATKRLSEGLRTKSVAAAAMPAQNNKEESMISIVTGQKLGGIPWAASAHATEQEVKAIEEYESVVVLQKASVAPSVPRETGVTSSLVQSGSITRIPFSKSRLTDTPKEAKEPKLLTATNTATAPTKDSALFPLPNLPNKRPASELESSSQPTKKASTNIKLDRAAVIVPEYVPPDEKSSSFVGTNASESDLEEVMDVSVSTFALYTAPEADVPFYESPLTCCWTNRFSPFFLKGDTKRAFAPCYNSALVPDAANRDWCPNDLNGKTCSKKDCPKVHFDDYNVEPQTALKSIIQQGTQDKTVKQDFASALGEQKAKHGSKMEPVQVVDLLLKVMKSDNSRWQSNVNE